MWYQNIFILPFSALPDILACVDGVFYAMIGDGYCNDETNNEDCNYDGGDCCGTCVITNQCSECECLGGVSGNGDSSAALGNGYCDDETNNADCYYDGLDCCGSLVNQDHCSSCTCHSMYFYSFETMMDIL